MGETETEPPKAEEHSPQWTVRDHVARGYWGVSVMNQQWATVIWAAAGALVGIVLNRAVTQRLATAVSKHVITSWPLGAAATAALFGLLAWRFTLDYDVLAYSCLAAVSVPLASIDLTELRLPSALIWPTYPITTGFLVLAAVADHNWSALLRSLAGMIVLFAFFLVMYFASNGMLGGGDVRLAGLLGLVLAWRGWNTMISGTFAGLVYAALAGAILIALRRASPQTPVPFGPALLAGTFTGLCLTND